MRRAPWYLAIAGLLPLALACADDGVRPDPLPLSRVRISPDRVQAALERFKGTLVLLPQTEFEAKVQRAALAVELADKPPRLTKTRYKAQLVNQALVGSAEWTVVQQTAGPGVLSLTDFNLAMTRRATVNGAKGIVGELDGKSPGLWIDSAAPSTIRFDWSRRGTPRGSGIDFDLQVPVCANAQLELILPVDYQMKVSKPGLLVEGPRAAADPGQQAWLVSFSGRSRVELVLGRLETGTAVLLSSLRSRQELSPNRVMADYDFEIEALHGPVSQLVFDGDFPLQPYDVTVGGLEIKGWQWEPAPAGSPTAGGALVVPLPAPAYGALPQVRVRCLAAALSDTKKARVWVSPGLHLRGALSRGEELDLRTLPETQLERWQAGQFRLIKTSTEPDGSELLTLVHGGSPEGSPTGAEVGPGLAPGAPMPRDSALPERPTAVLKARRAQFLLEQHALWQIDLQGATLISELTCKPLHGQLYHLPLKLPPDSQVDQIGVLPKEALRGLVTSGSRQTPMLLIDLAQPATAQTPVTIKVELRLPSRSLPKPGPFTLELPDIEPMVPCLREGSLAVTIHPRWRVKVEQPSWPATAAPEGAVARLRPGAAPDYYFAYRGKPLTGKLRLEPRASQFKATCHSDAFIGGGRGALATRLTIEPLTGSLEQVDLLVSTALAEPWQVRGDFAAPRIASVQRLPGLDAMLALGARDELDALSVLATQAGVQRWRLRFTEPVRSRVTVVLEAPFDPVALGGDAGNRAERPWIVPVVAVADAEQFNGELAVQLIGAEITDAQSDQMQEMPRLPGKAATLRGVQQVWRVYRYDHSAGTGRFPRLRVMARAVALELAARETCDAAALTTYIEPSGRLVHHLQFRLANWRKPDAPVLLPAGTDILGARTEGRWLASLNRREREDGLEVELPANAALASQDFDLYYSTAGEASTWAPWERLQVQPPKLPVRPLDMRHSWVLPPGVEPFGRGWQRMAGQPEGTTAKQWEKLAEKVWHGGQSWLRPWLLESGVPDGAAAQQQQLAAAEAALQRQFGPDSGWVLGPVVEALALKHMPRDVPVVIDAEALAAAGLSRDSVFGTGGDSANGKPWARLQLAVMPTPRGLLITTRQQWHHWTLSGEVVADELDSLMQAVGEAAQRGHDATGRFYSAASWAQIRTFGSKTGNYDPAQVRGVVLPDSFGAHWTQWEPRASVEPCEEIVLVRPLVFYELGLFLSGLVILALVAAARRARPTAWLSWHVRFLVLIVGALAVAAFWMPASIRAVAVWPVATAVVLGGAWYIAGGLMRRGESAPAPSGVRPSVAGVLTLLVLVLAAASLPPAWSQGVDIGTVLVLPGPPGAPERQDVLVAPELLKTLDNLSQRGPSGLHGAVLIAARYEGTLSGEAASLTAEFQIHSFGNKAPLMIPMTGVELSEGALLDGAAVQPVASPGGYTITVNERGSHRLILPFTVRLQKAANHRDLDFRVPRVFQSKLLLQVPTTWPETIALSGLGGTRLEPADAQHQQLVVDIGRDSSVHLRWPEVNSKAPAAKIAVREGYFWDLRSPGSQCTAVLRYSVKGGKVDRFSIALPDTLEPRGVMVMGDGTERDETAIPRLREWHRTGDASQRRLDVQLQEAAAGEVVVTVQLVPRQLLGPGAVRLPLPLPLGAQSMGGLVGYRTAGFEAADKAFNMMTLLLTGAQFGQQWQALGQPEAVTATRAFSFRNRKVDAALVLSLTPRQPTIDQDLSWKLFSGRAELQAILKATIADDQLMVVEWDIPPVVTIAEIAGDNIQSWTRESSDGRVQIWLKQPSRAIALNVRGWTFTGKQTTKQALPWALPWLHSPNAASTRTVVRIAGTGELRAEPGPRRFVNLTALQPATALSWICQGPDDFYQAEFLLRSAVLPAQLLAVTTMEDRERALQLLGEWQVLVPHSGKANFTLRVDKWQGSSLKLEGPNDVIIRGFPGQRGPQQWQIIVPADAPRRLQLKLTGTRPFQAGSIVELPRFQLFGATWSGHWLAARLPGLELQAASGVEEIKVLRGDSGLPPGVADHLSQGARVWKTVAPDWKMSLIARAPAAAPGMKALLAEQEIVFGEGCGWIHQAGWWMHVKDTTELAVDMPAGALLLAASADGAQINPRFVAPDRLALALPPGEGLRRLVLRWVIGPEMEPLTRPQLAAPRIEGLAAVAANWTITLPPGFRLAAGGAALDTLPALALARQELAQAEAQQVATQLLADQIQKSGDLSLKTQLLASQALLERHQLLAAHALEIGGEQGSEIRGELKKKQMQLRQQNAVTLKAAGLADFVAKGDKAGSNAGKDPEPVLQAGRGTVLRWRGSIQEPPLVLELVSTDIDEHQRAWAATVLVVVAMLCAWMLSCVEGAVRYLHRLWPEQIALVALVGWAIWGFSIVALALLLLAAAWRLSWCGSWLRHWPAGRRAPLAAATSSQGPSVS